MRTMQINQLCGLLTAVIESTLTDEPLGVCCSAVGWCGPDDELILLLGLTAVMVATILGGVLKQLRNSKQ